MKVDAVLSADHVAKSYGAVRALEDASLELCSGEIVALAGPNGSGKTTLLKILATLLTRDRGEITVLGRSLDGNENQIRHWIGYVGQDSERSAYARLTARENLEFFGSLRGLSRAEVARRTEMLAARFECQATLDKLFMNLSGGQKQVIVIMRALLCEPPIAYLDEPTKGLDAPTARRVRAWLRNDARDRGKTLLITSHIAADIASLADRIVLIHRGRTSAPTTPADLKAAFGFTAVLEIGRGTLAPLAKEALLGLGAVLARSGQDPEHTMFHLPRDLDWQRLLPVLRAHDLETRALYRAASLEDAIAHGWQALAERAGEP